MLNFRCATSTQQVLVAAKQTRLTHKAGLQNTEQETQGLRSRLEATEQRQQQMMTFLTKAVQNPVFLQQLLNQRQAQRISGPDKSEGPYCCHNTV